MRTVVFVREWVGVGVWIKSGGWETLFRLMFKQYERMPLGQGEGEFREFGMDMHTLLYLKWITNKDIL